MSSSRHPPFAEVEASRAPFDTADVWEVTKIPEPGWQPGGGTSKAGLPGVKEGLWAASAGKKTRVIDPEEIPPVKIYKMMISAVTPRPIGFISSASKDGTLNLAPFSFFNMVSHDPPMVMASFSHPSPTKLKETASNILETGEFVTNIISMPFVEAANFTSADCPPEVSEWDISGLTPLESKLVKPPRVGESAFSMECKLEHSYDIYNDAKERTATVVIGRVRLFHVRDDIVDDNLLVDTAKLQPVSRLGGISYGRTTRAFESPRPVWSKLKEDEAIKALVAGKASD